MLQKLYSLVKGDISPDNPDSPMNQEVLLPGHLYLIYLKVIFIKKNIINNILQRKNYKNGYTVLNILLKEKLIIFKKKNI